MNLGKFSTVREFMSESTDDHVMEHNLTLPASIDIWMDEDLVSGSTEFFGKSLLDSYVAFSLAANADESDGADAAWVIVSDMYGNLQNVRPCKLRGSQMKRERFEALKIWNASTLLLAEFFSNNDDSMPLFILWNWQTNTEEMIHINAKYGSHDVEHVPDDNAVITVQDTNNITEYSLETGESIWSTTWHELCLSSSRLSNKNPPDVMVEICATDAHMNRVQQQSAHTVYASSRDLGGLLKIEKKENVLEWILGGPFGDFTMVDENGTEWPAGYELWNHQHNFEWIGENKFIMFDNGATDPEIGNFTHKSRFLMIEIDETKMQATVIWEWCTGGHTPIWGDADVLPNGNVIGPSWDEYVDPSANGTEKYQAHIWEVTSDKKIAWSLHVKGACIPQFMCVGDTQKYLRRKDESPKGWAIYSAERFMATPLLTNVTMVDYHDGDGGVVTLTAYNSYRSSFSVDADITIFEPSGSVLAVSHVSLNAMWRPLQASISLSGKKWKVLKESSEIAVKIVNAKQETTIRKIAVVL